MDWPILLQIVTLLTVALSGAFTTWIAFKQNELRVRLETVKIQTETISHKTDSQGIKLEQIGYTIDGQLEKLIASQLHVGRLEGIKEEQVRIQAQADTVTTDARRTAAGVVLAAEKIAEKRIGVARVVAQELAATQKAEPISHDIHTELTDAAHLAVQDLSDETKP